MVLSINENHYIQLRAIFDSVEDPFSNTSGNQNGLGITCGAMNWSLGIGTLQKIVLNNSEIVKSCMPNFGEDFLHVCKLSPFKGCMYALKWQSPKYLLNKSFNNELKKFLNHPTIIALQKTEIQYQIAEAIKLATTINPNPTDLDVIWCLDLLQDQSGLKGATVAMLDNYMSLHSSEYDAIESICDWFSTLKMPMAQVKESHKNGDNWLKYQIFNPRLFVLSFIRAQFSHSQFRGAIAARRCIIAAGAGWWDGTFINMKLKFPELYGAKK